MAVLGLQPIIKASGLTTVGHFPFSYITEVKNKRVMKIITIYVQDLIFRLLFFVIKGHSQISSVHFKD